MTNGKALALCFNLVNQTDEVNEQGQHVQRTEFPKAHYIGLKNLKEKLLGTVKVTIETENASPVVVSLDEYKAMEPKPKVLGEAFVESEIELTDKEKAALKYCADDRESIPSVDDEALSGFEELSGFALVK